MREKYTLSYRHRSGAVYAADISLSDAPYTKIISLKNKPILLKHHKMLMQGILIALNNDKLKIRETTDGK